MKVGSFLRREKVGEAVLGAVAPKLEGGLDVVGGEIIGEAKRKVLANIENHKQEHKRWVNVWRNAHRTCTYIVQLLYYNNVTLHHCVTVVCGKVERVDSRAQGAEYKSCKPCKRCC